MSDCPLNSPVERLLWPLAFSESIAKVTAERANLTGTLPHLADYQLTVSLQTLDLAANQITRIEGLVAGGLLTLSGNDGVTFAPGVIRDAIKRNVRIDLRGINLNKEQASEALELLPTLNKKTPIDSGRLACYDFQATVLQVTPWRFLTDHLCQCEPGYARLHPTALRGHQC